MKLDLSLEIAGNPVEVGGETHEIFPEQAIALKQLAEHLMSRWPTPQPDKVEQAKLVVGDKIIEVRLGKGLAQRIYDTIEDVAWAMSAGHLK